MSNDGVDSAINKSRCMYDAFSLRGPTFPSELATSQEDDDNTENHQNPSSIYKGSQAVMVVEDKDQQDWQEHQDAVRPEQWVTLPSITCMSRFRIRAITHPLLDRRTSPSRKFALGTLFM